MISRGSFPYSHRRMSVFRLVPLLSRTRPAASWSRRETSGINERVFNLKPDSPYMRATHIRCYRALRRLVSTRGIDKQRLRRASQRSHGQARERDIFFIVPPPRVLGIIASAVRSRTGGSLLVRCAFE